MPTRPWPRRWLSLQVAPDFEYSKPQADTNLLFVHRKLPDGEVYWVNNRTNRKENLDATFRVTGKAAELWHPETGRIEPASYKIAGGRTTVPLRLEPTDAVFVVFRKAAAAPSRTVPARYETALATVEGPWEVSFQADRGAPAKITLDRLSSWHENSDAGVKYFSGTGTYTKTIQAPAEWFKTGTRLWIDLGDIKNLAEVTVNGKPLGILWKTPFQVDVTGALKPGANAVADQSDEPVGQPADRRPAAGRRKEVHLHHAAVLPRRLAPAALRTARPGADCEVGHRIGILLT